MNKERLLQAADWLEANVPQERFDISDWREGQLHTPECDSVGCAVGHLTAIDAENVNNNYKMFDEVIMFKVWSMGYFGLDAKKWNWCFASDWYEVDNTVKGAAARMRYLANNGLPYNWAEIMCGEEPVNYLPC